MRAARIPAITVLFLAVLAAGGTREKVPAGGCPAGMVRVPAGDFHLGTPRSTEKWRADERDHVRTRLDAFCMDRYEYPNASGKVPVTGVTWSDADESCRKEGKRLCSAMEWEKACKGPQDWTYSYGRAHLKGACADSKVTSGPAPSGAFEGCVSGYGAFDMNGNVREWTRDEYLPGSGDREVRGGAWNSQPINSRCARRYFEFPEAGWDDTGFRCCIDDGDPGRGGRARGQTEE